MFLRRNTPSEKRAAKASKSAAEKIKQVTELGDWTKVANEGTTLVQVLYTSHLVLLAIGFSIVYGTTHKQLFLDELVSVSLGQSLQIPLSAFYFLFPIVFVFLHFQLLWQIHHVVEKLEQLRTCTNVDGSSILKDHARLRLGNLVLSHTLFAKGWITSLASCLLFLSVAVAPLALLAFTQLKFLPFHSEWITCSHRVAFAVDAFIVLAIWLSIHRAKLRNIARQLQASVDFPTKVSSGSTALFRLQVDRVFIYAFTYVQIVSLTIIATSLFFVTVFLFMFPGERWERITNFVVNSVSPDWVAKPYEMTGSKDQELYFLWMSCNSGWGFTSYSDDDSIGSDYFWSNKPASLGRQFRIDVNESTDNTASCRYDTTTNVAVAVFFSDTRFSRSLKLRNEILTGESLSGADIWKLSESPRDRVLHPEFDDILSRVTLRGFQNRNFDFGQFDQSRLVRADLSTSSLGGAIFSNALLQGSKIQIHQSDVATPLPMFGNADISGGELSIYAITPIDVSLRAIKSKLSFVVKGQVNARSTVEVTAPFSYVYFGSNYVPTQCSACRNQQPNELRGNFSFSTLSLKGKALDIRAKLTGTSVFGHVNNLFFSTGDNPDSQLTDLRFSDFKIIADTMSFKNVDFRLASVAADLVKPTLKIGDAHLNFASTDAQNTFAFPDDLPIAEIVAQLEKSRPALPNNLPLTGTFLFRGDRWYDPKSFATSRVSGDAGAKLLSWCSATDRGQLICERKSLSTADTKSLATTMCDALLFDRDVLAFFEENAAAHVPGAYNSIMTKLENENPDATSKSNFSSYIDQLAACVNTRGNARNAERVRKTVTTLYSNNY